VARSLCKISSILILASCLPSPAAYAAAEESPKPKDRTFEFSYATTVTGLKPEQEARIWVPVPCSDESQDVELVTRDLPGRGKIDTEPQFGNRILHLAAKANADGEIRLRMIYRVTRREIRGTASRDIEEDAEQLARLLQPDTRVPIRGKPLDLLRGKELPTDEMEKARLLYDLVDRHMTYRKPVDVTGWGEGDAVWACEKGFGNCSDFHSLFISLARSQRIPAKFIIGFGLPSRRGSGDLPGYHCWAMFHPKGKGWVPVDISEASKDPRRRDYYFGNLSEDRVAFSTGRDLNLVPRQDGRPLNFFIYPYVVVNGKVYPTSKIRCRFTFRDE
jgi:transglutaminase-like putative cysteine protease